MYIFACVSVKRRIVPGSYSHPLVHFVVGATGICSGADTEEEEEESMRSSRRHRRGKHADLLHCSFEEVRNMLDGGDGEGVTHTHTCTSYLRATQSQRSTVTVRTQT